MTAEQSRPWQTPARAMCAYMSMSLRAIRYLTMNFTVKVSFTLLLISVGRLLPPKHALHLLLKLSFSLHSGDY